MINHIYDVFVIVPTMAIKNYFLSRSAFSELLQLLQRLGYRTFAPQPQGGALVYSELKSSDQLPCGVSDRQQPGHYRLVASDQQYWFNWANGPQGVKPFTFTPEEPLWQVSRDSDGRLGFHTVEPEVVPTALIGPRACDLAALRLQEAHFLQGEYPDSHFKRRREQLLLIGVDCCTPAETCFCFSTGDGPKIECGFDLALTELESGFIVRADSEQGESLIRELQLEQADDRQLVEADRRIEEAIKRQPRSLPSGDLPHRLLANLEDPHWQEVGERCLACGNCTLVCPTCFCHSELERPALDGDSSEHLRRWDSCFSHDHSYIHGLLVRPDARTRYRQWLVHKLATWHEQYGRSGCVGCGRCISWCPVGIDITEEAEAIAGEQT